MATKKRHNICKECGATRWDARTEEPGCDRYDVASGDIYIGFNHVWTY